LYNNEVSVPKPHGVFLVNRFASKNYWNISEKNPSFLMDYLEGYKQFNQLEERLKRRVNELKKKEIIKIKELGWFPNDFNSTGNLMYSKEKDDLKIIDFGRYKEIRNPFPEF